MRALGLAKAVRALAGVPSQVARESRDRLAEHVNASMFEAGADPYGTAWKGLAPSTIARKGHALPGTHTHAMRGTYRFDAQGGSGLKLTVGVPYAEYFDAARRLMPSAGLPGSWRAIIAEVFADAVAERLK